MSGGRAGCTGRVPAADAGRGPWSSRSMTCNGSMHPRDGWKTRRARLSRQHGARFPRSPKLGLVEFWSSSGGEERRRGTKPQPSENAQLRQMAKPGERWRAFRVNRMPVRVRLAPQRKGPLSGPFCTPIRRYNGRNGLWSSNAHPMLGGAVSAERVANFYSS